MRKCSTSLVIWTMLFQTQKNTELVYIYFMTLDDKDIRQTIGINV